MSLDSLSNFNAFAKLELIVGIFNLYMKSVVHLYRVRKLGWNFGNSGNNGLLFN